MICERRPEGRLFTYKGRRLNCQNCLHFFSVSSDIPRLAPDRTRKCHRINDFFGCCRVFLLAHAMLKSSSICLWLVVSNYSLLTSQVTRPETRTFGLSASELRFRGIFNPG